MANNKNITFNQLEASMTKVKAEIDKKANTSHGNHVPKTETANNARFLRNDNTWQTITPVNIGAADRSHTHGEYINQNTFTNVKIGDTTIEADSPTDTLTLNAGANVTITPDAINDTVTIEAKDTIYTHPTNPGNRHIPSGGSSGQILRWSEDGTAAWGSENNTFTNGSIGGFTVTPENLVGNNVGMTSFSGHGYAFWAGVNGAENSESAPFKVGHEGKLYAYNADLAGTLNGNATTATRLQAAHKFTIGNTEKYFDGSADVAWTLDEIGASSVNHMHTSIDHLGDVPAQSTGERPPRNGISMQLVYNNGYPYSYGNVLNLKGTGDGQLFIGWSGSTGAHAPVYVRSKRDTGDAWSDWAQFYTTVNPQTDITGNAGTATKLQTARTLTIGNTGKEFDGSNNVSWSLDEMGVTSAIQVAENDAKMDIRHNYVTKHEVAHYFEGENKWKLDVYSLGSMSASAYPTKETMIQNNCQYQRSYLVEHPSYSGDSYGNNYVGYATTYIHFTEDYQWNGRVVTDDNGNVYLNDVLVLSTPTCQWVDITLNFKAGWNKLEVLYAEGGGGDGWQFDSEIVVVPGGVLDKMNCYGQNSIVADWAYGSVGGTTTINGDKIQTNTITANQLAMSDFSNFSQLRPRENLSNRYGYANWGGGGEDYHFYWANGDSEYLPFTINETPNPFKHGDKIGFKFEAYAQVDLDVAIGVYFYSSDDCLEYLAERTTAVHIYPGWNGYSAQVTIDCSQAKLARSVAIMMKKGATNYVEVRNVVISRAISNVMIEDRAVTANKLGTIGGFQVEDRLLRGRNGTEGNNYVGMSGDGFEWAFWAGAYNGGDAPFHVGHEGHLYATNATLAGTLDGNATTASRLQSARTLTIGNTGKNFDGSGNVSWSLAEIGAAASGHTHDSISGGNTYITTVGNDTYSLDMPNNIDISSWFGVSITNNCANTENYRQTTVAINARTGEASFRGRITARGAYMTNNIEFSEAGTSNSSAPGLVWNGSTDGADLYYRTLEADQGQLLINLRDDSNATLAIAWNGEVKATFDANGYYSGNAGSASRLQYARTFTVGNTGKNFDGTGNISWSLDEIGAAPSSHGHNFMYVKGTNTIGSVNDDTTGNWGAQGNSVHWYAGVGGLLHDQPNEWGYLLNIGQGAEVHQVWMTQASGNLYHRGGNGSGWSGSWKTILDSDNYSTWAAAKNHTHTNLVTKTVSNSTLTLGTELYQYAAITSNTTIKLPSTSSFTEIHLFFNWPANVSVTMPSGVKWQQGVMYGPGHVHEFVFTYVNNIGWLGGCVVYG